MEHLHFPIIASNAIHSLQVHVMLLEDNQQTYGARHVSSQRNLYKYTWVLLQSKFHLASLTVHPVFLNVLL